MFAEAGSRSSEQVFTDERSSRRRCRLPPGPEGPEPARPGSLQYFENVQVQAATSRIVITGNPRTVGVTTIYVNGAFTANGGVIPDNPGFNAADLRIIATGSDSGPQSELNIDIAGNADFTFDEALGLPSDQQLTVVVRPHLAE
jgi:hypothetical protein